MSENPLGEGQTVPPAAAPRGIPYAGGRPASPPRAIIRGPSPPAIRVGAVSPGRGFLEGPNSLGSSPPPLLPTLNFPAPPPLPGSPLEGVPPFPGFVPKVVPKNQPKPRVKMRPLHWKMIQPKKIQSTIWGQLGQNGDDIDLDIDEIEEKFSAKVKRPQPHRPCKPTPRSRPVSLLDSKRRYNMEIALHRIKDLRPYLKQAVLAMDEKVLTEALLPMMLAMCPTQEEMQMLKMFERPENLADADEFVLEVSSIPRFRERLEFLLFKYEFSKAADLLDNITALGDYLQFLVSSEGLRFCLALTLKVGNYLNGGTRKGNAYGFHLSSLSMFDRIKTKDNSGTLLQFIAKTMQEKNPEGTQELISGIRQHAFRLYNTEYEDELQNLSKQCMKYELILRDLQDSSVDRIKAVMGKFCREAREEISKIQNIAKDLQSTFEETRSWFGEQKLSLDELLDLFRTFFTSFKKCVDNWNDMDLELGNDEVADDEQKIEADEVVEVDCLFFGRCKHDKVLKTKYENDHWKYECEEGCKFNVTCCCNGCNALHSR